MNGPVELVGVGDLGHAEQPGGDVRSGVGRQRRGIDRHGKAVILEHARRGQPDHTATDHRRFAMGRRERQPERHVCRAPGQRDAAAAVAVIVNDGLVAESLGADHEAGAAEGTQARDLLDDPVLGDIDLGQRRRPARSPATESCARANGSAPRCPAAPSAPPFNKRSPVPLRSSSFQPPSPVPRARSYSRTPTERNLLRRFRQPRPRRRESARAARRRAPRPCRALRLRPGHSRGSSPGYAASDTAAR